MKSILSFVCLSFVLALVVPGSGFAATLAAGGHQTCAIDALGAEVRCWGRGDAGELGDGHDNLLASRAAPVEVMASVPLRAIDSGGRHSCGLSAGGGVYCWGYNASGQLGDGTTLYRNVPTAVLGLSSGITALALGDAHTCALLASGAVKCWGESDNGRLGTGDTSDQTQPRNVLQLSGVTAIDAGIEHTCALVGGGNVRCWGGNSDGQVGDGTWTMRTIPVDTQIEMNVAEIAVGGGHTCARSSAGAMQCWGRNYSGQLGDGTNTSRNLPVNVDGLGSGVTKIASGGYHTCARAAGQVLKCWGYNATGQLGEGTTGNRNRPTNVIDPPAPVTELSLGLSHSCVRGSANVLHCWGESDYGKLGRFQPGNVWHSGAPGRVTGLESPAVALSMYDASSCAVTDTGGARCWGGNYYGQLGNGAQFTGGSNIDYAGPERVVSLDSGVRDVAMGLHHACAAKTDGSVWCWGRNDYNQLADGTTVTRITPVQVAGIDDAVTLAAGENFTCMLSSGGGVRCWGRNQVGQLGDGSLEDRGQPVDVVGLGEGVIALSAGEVHVCALMDESHGATVQCWGEGAYGRIGDGTTTDRYLPTPIDDAGAAYVAIAAGFDHTCGITATGGAKCWGYNGSGQIGDGSQSSRYSPTSVDGLATGVSLVSTGGNHTCAVHNGQLKCWGYNSSYQVGDGTATTRVLPTAVVGLGGGVATLELGNSHSCARMTSGRTKCWGYNYEGRLGNGATNSVQQFPIDIAQWSYADLIFADGFDS